MRHSVHLDGYAYGLRPVEEADAAFIVAVRAERGRFLNRGAQDEAAQRAWLARYFEREGDYYFVVESLATRAREGLAGLYDVDAQARVAEWGRWVVAHGSAAAVESALLVYRCAFEVLDLESVFCRTLASNAQVVAFHDSCGLRRSPGEEPIDVDGAPSPGVRHTLSRDAWPGVRDRLGALARRLAARRTASLGAA